MNDIFISNMREASVILPNSWQLRKNKYNLTVLNGYAFNSNLFSLDTGIPLVRIRDITSGKVSTFYTGEYDQRYLISKGDILIGMDGDFNVRKWDGPVSLLNQRCCKVIPFDEIDGEYVYYTLPFGLNLINSLTYSTTVKHLSSSDILNMKIPVPPYVDQKRIVNFLTNKVSMIDELIEVQETSIEKLVEFKNSIITKTLTKGLNTDIEMKDSGVDWIGLIPIHWNVSKLKYEAKIIMGQSPSSSSYNHFESGLPFLGGNADIDNRVSNPRFFTSEVTKECDVSDVLMSVRAPVGTVAKSIHKACIGRGLCALRSNSNGLIYNEYLYYYLLFLESKWDSFITGTTFESINQRDIKEMPCFNLKDEEKVKITTYLNKKTHEIDQLIRIKKDKINKLHEYKKSLIFEAVTGKIEVM